MSSEDRYVNLAPKINLDEIFLELNFDLRTPTVRRRTCSDWRTPGPRSAVSLCLPVSPAPGDCGSGQHSASQDILQCRRTTVVSPGHCSNYYYLLGRHQGIVILLLLLLLLVLLLVHQLPQAPVCPHHGQTWRRSDQNCQPGQVDSSIPPGLHHLDGPRHGLRPVQLEP